MKSKEEFKKALIDAMTEFTSYDDYITFGENTQLEIDPKTFSVELASCDDNDSEKDYYTAMDLVKWSDSEHGECEPDMEVIDEIVAEYFDS